MSVHTKAFYYIATFGFFFSDIFQGVAAADQLHICRPQEGLQLDKAISPSRQNSLTFCHQYKDCSCCNVSHTANIQRNLEHVLHGDEVSSSCKAFSSLMACRVCDPEVGVGLKWPLCESTCTEWFEACQLDYFAFTPISQRLQICDGTQVLCSPLVHLASDGIDFCKKAGMPISKRQCFTGRMRPNTNMCAGTSEDSDKPSTAQASLIMVYLMVITCILVWILFCGPETLRYFGRRPAPVEVDEDPKMWGVEGETENFPLFETEKEE
ncbi:hypothetical protein CYMTET_9880 [Cymbomonas tetramitiformis]|uniref:Folate receptor-like domain-containing protein n=1 Tax=Cymbomonas tetramitiformis TaxID=36881 RepID=A0AAE0LEK6_9CHLO|nr:hypothetical protein CYMTET_9880 [Cymbomonas tetramitiformis]